MQERNEPSIIDNNIELLKRTSTLALEICGPDSEEYKREKKELDYFQALKKAQG